MIFIFYSALYSFTVIYMLVDVFRYASIVENMANGLTATQLLGVSSDSCMLDIPVMSYQVLHDVCQCFAELLLADITGVSSI